MAVFRQIHTSFWQDSFVLELTPEEKYFYLYLMTNPKTSASGIYELPKKVMELETGYNRETVEKLLQRFIDYKKILYSNETKEIMLLNWLKYNNWKSPSTQICIQKELQTIKNERFKQLAEEIIGPLQAPYTPPIGPMGVIEREKDTDIDTEKDIDIPYVQIQESFNSICLSYPKVIKLTKARKSKLKTRWEEVKSLDKFIEIFTKMEQSDFMKGKNKNKWTATFDWVIDNDTNYIKVLEGNYDNKGGANTGTTQSTTGQAAKPGKYAAAMQRSNAVRLPEVPGSGDGFTPY